MTDKEAYTSVNAQNLVVEIEDMMNRMEWIDQFHDGPEFVEAMKWLKQCQEILLEKRKQYDEFWYLDNPST